jgi:hypothetical protein
MPSEHCRASLRLCRKVQEVQKARNQNPRSAFVGRVRPYGGSNADFPGKHRDARISVGRMFRRQGRPSGTTGTAGSGRAAGNGYAGSPWTARSGRPSGTATLSCATTRALKSGTTACRVRSATAKASPMKLLGCKEPPSGRHHRIVDFSTGTKVIMLADGRAG